MPAQPLSRTLTLLLVCFGMVEASRRLTVSGSRLLSPEGNEVRPVGFNWNAITVTPAEGDGRLMQTAIPGVNLARIIGIKWLNDHPLSSPPHRRSSAHECYMPTAPYFQSSCLSVMDAYIKEATSNSDNWVIVTVRGMFAAGQLYKTDPGGVVFLNSTLREHFFQAWEYIAEHYKTWDNIAAFEILSEPRVNIDVDASVVSGFYEAGCARVQTVDSATPCMVGPRWFYNIHLFDESILLKNKNVIYTFDYFQPNDYFGGPPGKHYIDVPKYPGKYKCADLYKGFATDCPGGYHKRNDLMMFDKTWHQTLLQRAGLLKTNHNVPVFLNQWAAAHGISADNGRYNYISDIANLTQEMGIGWAWWAWRGSSQGWVNGSTKIASGTQLDHRAIAALAPYMQ